MGRRQRRRPFSFSHHIDDAVTCISDQIHMPLQLPQSLPGPLHLLLFYLFFLFVVLVVLSLPNGPDQTLTTPLVRKTKRVKYQIKCKRESHEDGKRCLHKGQLTHLLQQQT